MQAALAHVAVAEASGPRAMLNALHPGIRCRGQVLEVELSSGAHVEAAATGAGIRVVPTLSDAPGVTLSSDGHAPIVLTCPVPLPGDQVTGTGPLSCPALDNLIGPSRSMLLSVIAAHPGQGTRELARRSGFAPPRSASTHRSCARPA